MTNETKCQKCHRPTAEENLHVHHIIPRNEGGSDSPENLTKICSDCHFEIHHPNRENGDAEQFNNEYADFIKLNVFSEGYGIMPRKVALDQAISPGSKILYCELSSLCAERGYSWATNAYLAKKYQTSPKTISRWITEIEKYLYIENRAGAGRKIWVHTLVGTPLPKTKMSSTQDKNVQVNLDKNVPQNSITVNNKIIPFGEFWKLYPKKTGKKPAEQKWNRLNKTTQDLILADLPKRAKTDQWQKADGQFVPNPATYLNQERWNDQLPGQGASIVNYQAQRDFEREQDRKRQAQIESERADENSPGKQKFKALKEKFKIGH